MIRQGLLVPRLADCQPEAEASPVGICWQPTFAAVATILLPISGTASAFLPIPRASRVVLPAQQAARHVTGSRSHSQNSTLQYAVLCVL